MFGFTLDFPMWLEPMRRPYRYTRWAREASHRLEAEQWEKALLPGFPGKAPGLSDWAWHVAGKITKI